MEDETQRPYLEDHYVHGRGIVKTFMTVTDWINFWVPFEWRDSICTCEVTDSLAAQRYTDEPRVCSRCGKYQRWQLAFCSNCREAYFIKFTHHLKNNHLSRCYACLVKQGGEKEGDAPPVVKPRELRDIKDILNDDIDFDLEFNV